MRNWIEFYESTHSIYVNDRHRDVHYRDIADQIAALLPGRHARVLDFGCGEALHADRVAAAAAELVLCDAARTVREHLAARFGGNPRIKVASPDELADRSDHSLDLIIANSVVQYLSADQLAALLASWRRLLAPEGTLVVADVIPPGVGVVSDAIALLRYAAAHRFLIAAVVGLARTAISPYRRLRATLAIAHYGESDFLRILDGAAFTARRLPQNMEHNPARMTFAATPAHPADR